MSEEKLNKKDRLIKALKGGLYQQYIEGDLVLQDIADQFEVSVQYVASVIKNNEIGMPRKQRRLYKAAEQKKIQVDIENGLPIEYFEGDYKILKGLSGTINVFNTITRWRISEQISLNITHITAKKLNKIILDVNIMKYIRKNNNSPKESKLRLVDIAELFRVSFGVVGNISRSINKGYLYSFSSKDTYLVKIVMRNLEIVKEVMDSDFEYEEAIIEASRYHGVDVPMVKRIINCNQYAKNADLDQYVQKRKDIVKKDNQK